MRSAALLETGRRKESLMNTQFTPPASNGQPTANNGYHAPEITRADFETIADRLGLTIPDGQNRRGPNPFTREGKDGFCFFFPECNGTDREGKFTPSRREMLELAGFSAPISINAPTSQPSAKTDGKEFDTRSLEMRGLTPEARQFFRVSAPLDTESVWGEYRQFPTFHADGTEARHRRKFRDPARQPNTDRTGKPRRQAKNLWDKATEAKGMPPAYGLNHIEAGETVYLVNSELAVWLYWQEGKRAICPLGEGRSEKSFCAIFQVVKDKGAAELVSMLDADERGQSATETALKAARAVGLPASAKQWREGVKIGFDASDFREECHTQGRDFGAALDELPDRAEAPKIEGEQVLELRFPRSKLREIFERPRLEELIEGFFIEVGTGVLTNDYGGFKSFIALDMGLSVATGRAWQGRAVKRGTVVYITPEGAYTIADRVKAWMIRHGIKEIPQNFELIEMPVQIGEAVQCAALIDELRELSPALVILDTVAKCNIGRDENDAAAMGLFTHSMEKIARDLGAFVLAIHHNNKEGKARGSNSLPANVDASIVLKRAPNRIVSFECDRVKGAPFEPFSLIGRVVELPDADKHGKPRTSLVFEPTDAPTETMPKADQTREQVFDVLKNKPEGLTATNWQKATGISESRFYDHRDALLKAGRITQTGRVYKVTPITPITPKRSQSEQKFNSDYSDDSLESEQSESFAGVNSRSSLFQADEAHDPFADVEIEAEEES